MPTFDRLNGTPVVAPVGSSPDELELDPEELEPTTRATTIFPLPPRSQDTADVIGLKPLIDRAAALKAQQTVPLTPEREVRLLAVQQDLFDRFLQVVLEVSEVVAELDCEKVRAEELAVRLEEIENDRRNKRTVIAVLAEPSFHILAATSLVFGMPVVAGALEVVGNGIRLTYGLAAGRVGQNEELSHRHNFLGEVWHGPDEQPLFPDVVWQFLNQPARPGEAGSRRDLVMSAWRTHLGRPGSPTEQRRLELFFGRGGVYGVRDLRHRADMLSLLSAFVTLMIHDISTLTHQTLL